MARKVTAQLRMIEEVLHCSLDKVEHRAAEDAELEADIAHHEIVAGGASLQLVLGGGWQRPMMYQGGSSGASQHRATCAAKVLGGPELVRQRIDELEQTTLEASGDWPARIAKLRAQLAGHAAKVEAARPVLLQLLADAGCDAMGASAAARAGAG